MFAVLAVVLGLMSAEPALAADANRPHPHQGIITAYKTAPERPPLTAEDLATLAEGDSVMKQHKDADSGGRGVAVQDINAPVEIVWSKITDYSAYPVMVENVKECESYEVKDDHIRTRFVISAMLMNVEYFIDHVYKPQENYLTWTLDYTRESDLDDSVGFWWVEAIEDKPGWTRVFYSVEVKLRGWIPAAVENMIAKQGLPKATAWVKRESEKAAGTAPPEEE